MRPSELWCCKARVLISLSPTLVCADLIDGVSGEVVVCTIMRASEIAWLRIGLATTCSEPICARNPGWHDYSKPLPQTQLDSPAPHDASHSL